MGITVDVSATCAVMVCDCGTRVLAEDRRAAWVAAYDHTRRVHADPAAAKNIGRNIRRLSAP